MIPLQRCFFLCLGVGLTLPGIHPPAWSQTFPEPDCSTAFDYETYQPSTAKRTVNLPQFGIQVTIAADTRTMAMADGRVLMVDPGTYHLFKCPGPGQGIYSLSFVRKPNPNRIALNDFAAQNSEASFFYPRRLETQTFAAITAVLIDYPSPVQADDSGYYASAFFQVPGIPDVIELSATCDCPVNREDLIPLLSTLKLLSP